MLTFHCMLPSSPVRPAYLSCLHTIPQVGLVSQEPTLFQTSILENIALGRPGATLEEVQEAARRANAHKFISVMPKGYDTQVGARMCTPSRGGVVPGALAFELRGRILRDVCGPCGGVFRRAGVLVCV